LVPAFWPARQWASVEAPAGVVGQAGWKISSNDNVEPLLRYVQEHPVCTALAALGIGLLSGKML
jgi:hypothetical protein